MFDFTKQPLDDDELLKAWNKARKAMLAQGTANQEFATAVDAWDQATTEKGKKDGRKEIDRVKAKRDKADADTNSAFAEVTSLIQERMTPEPLDPPDA